MVELPSTPLIPPAIRSKSAKSAHVRVVHGAGNLRAPASEGIAELKRHGLRVQHRTPAKNEERQDPVPDYLAGSDEERLAQVQGAIDAPDCRAAWFYRGGYGCMRLLEDLEEGSLGRNPTWLVGYSDVTALHLWAHAQGVATLHAPMTASLKKHVERDKDTSLDRCIQLLEKPAPTEFRNLRSLSKGEAEGLLTGGNLALMAAMIGTRWLPDLAGKILFLEEIEEPLYSIDRMLTSLTLDGRCDRLAGVVLGDFLYSKANGHYQFELEHLVRERFSRFNIPVLRGVPSGHGLPNHPVMMGVPMRIEGNALVAPDATKALFQASPK